MHTSPRKEALNAYLDSLPDKTLLTVASVRKYFTKRSTAYLYSARMIQMCFDERPDIQEHGFSSGHKLYIKVTSPHRGEVQE